MKNFLSAICIAIALYFCNIYPTNYDPLLVIIIMVKNEESVIVETLAPYVQAGIDSFLVFDTGSTDNTIPRIQKYFEENNISNALILQEEFIDFATSRNRALDLGLQHFPNAGYFLMPDAEWYMRGAIQLVEFCKKEAASSSQTPLYLVHIGNESTDFGTARLFKADTTVRFVGSVHECPDYVAYRTLPENIYFYWSPSQIGQEKTRKRWERDLGLILKDYHANPRNPRAVFYLAQTYQCLGENEKAAHFYKERALLDIIPEETFMAWYRLAQTTERLAACGRALWKDALEYYLKAYTYRPTRAEPLIRLAHYYLSKDNHALAFLFARTACEIKYPYNDYLFIDKHLYQYERFEILSRCAWYTGNYDLGEWAAREALKSRPYDFHLQANLSFYEQRKAAQSVQV